MVTTTAPTKPKYLSIGVLRNIGPEVMAAIEAAQEKARSEQGAFLVRRRLATMSRDRFLIGKAKADKLAALYAEEAARRNGA